MEDRDELLRKCRPSIALAYNASVASEELIFQNEVLRPILKFQNDLLVNLFNHELVTRKIDVGGLDEQELRNKINQLLIKDQSIKHKMMGICVAMFTEKELSFYLQHQKSINKRILSMLAERIHDNILN